MKNILPYLADKIGTFQSGAKNSIELLELKKIKDDLQPLFPGVPRDSRITLNKRLAFLIGITESDFEDFDLEDLEDLDSGIKKRFEKIKQEGKTRMQVIENLLEVYHSLPEINSEGLPKYSSDFLDNLHNLKDNEQIIIEDCSSIIYSKRGNSFSFSYRGVPILCKSQDDLDQLLWLWDEEYNKSNPGFINESECLVHVEEIFDDAGKHKILNFGYAHHLNGQTLDILSQEAEMFFQDAIHKDDPNLSAYIFN